MKTILPLVLVLFFLTSGFGQSPKDSLLVFVGEKIEVQYSPEASSSDTIILGKDTLLTVSVPMDKRFIAKYKVLAVINGWFKPDTLTFFVYDHYGEPAFSKYKTVLLFVSSYKGKLYHEKYQYFDLYRTVDDRWASPYSNGDYTHPFKDKLTVKPERISFQDEVSYPVDTLSLVQRQTRFPKPYFDIKKGKAKAIYGNYVDDLVKLKLQTILKARGME